MGTVFDRSRATREWAFTLIEVIVVIGIIALVAGLILPVFSRAKESSTEVVSKNNLRQLATALTLYSGDHQEYLPPFTNCEGYVPVVLGVPDPPGPPPYSWPMHQWFRESVDSYVKNIDVWYCPTDPVKGKDRYYLGIRHLYTSYEFYPWANLGIPITRPPSPRPPVLLWQMSSTQSLLSEPFSDGNEIENEASLQFSGGFRTYRKSPWAAFVRADLSIGRLFAGRKIEVGSEP